MASPSSTASAKEYWGYLIAADKSPTPPFERLLLGIAKYIVRPQTQASSASNEP